VLELTHRDVDHALTRQPGWRRVGDRLVRDVTMRDFDEALALVERIARAAVDYKRRPDMCITEFNRVRLIVANLHHAGITQAELRLAAKVSAVIDDPSR
jgi:4a-hydroxytetrahydrobiopterin dehydratase